MTTPRDTRPDPVELCAWLTDRISEYLGMVLDATIVWDHPTIDQLGDYLDRLRDQPGAG
jgi:hypothetical protein